MDDDLDFMDDLPSLDEYDPEDVDVEVLNVFPFGTDDVFATVQLSDDLKRSRAVLSLKVRMGRNPSCRVILRIEDLLLSHVSLSVDDHVALQVRQRHPPPVNCRCDDRQRAEKLVYQQTLGTRRVVDVPFGEEQQCSYDKGAWLPMGTGTRTLHPRHAWPH